MTTMRGRLDSATLATLRAHVKGLMAANGPGLLSSEIVAFASALEREHGVTVDLAAVCDLGEPLVVVHPAAPARTLPGFDTLSPREREVARLVCAGLRNRQIADRLTISPATVKDHVHRVLSKTGMPSRGALAACYLGTV